MAYINTPNSNESHTYAWHDSFESVMSHIWMSHVTHIILRSPHHSHHLRSPCHTWTLLIRMSQMSHTYMRDMIHHSKESYNIYKWVMSRTLCSDRHIIHITLDRHVIHKHSQFEWVEWVTHINVMWPIMNESCHTRHVEVATSYLEPLVAMSYTKLLIHMSHTYMRDMTHHKWVVSHLWMSHVTRITLGSPHHTCHL